MLRIEKEDLDKISGGYITIENKFDTNETWINVHNDFTHEVVAFKKLSGTQSSTSRSSECETIRIFRRLDETYNRALYLQ